MLQSCSSLLSLPAQQEDSGWTIEVVEDKGFVAGPLQRCAVTLTCVCFCCLCLLFVCVSLSLSLPRHVLSQFPRLARALFLPLDFYFYIRKIRMS